MARQSRRQKKRAQYERGARRRLATESLESRLVLAADFAAISEVNASIHSEGTNQPSLARGAGDFNEDGFIDAQDIDMLAEAIRDGVQSTVFDLTSSNNVDKADMDFLVHDIIGTEYGDADLDQTVDEGDLVVWMANRFQSDLGWANGNFNGDEVVDVSDFSLWNRLRAPTVSLIVVGQSIDASELASVSIGNVTEQFPAETAELRASVTVGDFNGDEVVDAADIDLISAAVRDGDQDSMFDVDFNGTVESADRIYLINDILATRPGDADLDLDVDRTDLDMWVGSRFQFGTTWATGDFNGDGLTDVSDFSQWNANRHSSSEPLSVQTTGTADFSTPSTASDMTARNDSVATQAQRLRSGDLNGDSLINSVDIDLLATAIRTGLTEEKYDIDEDNVVDSNDMDAMIHEVFGTDYGDADLNGVVDAADRSVFEANKFTFDTGWSTGDFNGDGLTDVSDFSIWNSHRAPVVVAITVDNSMEEQDEEEKPLRPSTTTNQPFETTSVDKAFEGYRHFRKF